MNYPRKFDIFVYKAFDGENELVVERRLRVLRQAADTDVYLISSRRRRERSVGEADVRRRLGGRAAQSRDVSGIDSTPAIGARDDDAVVEAAVRSTERASCAGSLERRDLDRPRRDHTRGAGTWCRDVSDQSMRPGRVVDVL